MYDTVGNVFQRCQRSWSLIPAWWSCLNAAVFLASTCVQTKPASKWILPVQSYFSPCRWMVVNSKEWVVAHSGFSLIQCQRNQLLAGYKWTLYMPHKSEPLSDKETWGKLWTLRNTRCLRTNTRAYTHSTCTWKSNCVHYTSYVTNRIFENWGMFNISPVLAGAYSVT